MPSSFMSSFPSVSLAIEAMKAPLRAELALTESEEQALTASLELLKNQQNLAHETSRQMIWPNLMPLRGARNHLRLINLISKFPARSAG